MLPALVLSHKRPSIYRALLHNDDYSSQKSVAKVIVGLWLDGTVNIVQVILSV